MNICAYVHPISTFMPCTGLGRHINSMVLGLQERPDVNVNLLVAKKWINANGRLNQNSPLHTIPTQTFPFPERITEHCWKVFGRPYMDSWVDKNVDWVYCPAQTYLPFRKKKTAVTIHDIEAFETNLPWSNTKAHRHFRRKWSVWMGKMIRHTDIIFTVSEFSKKRMVALLNAPEEKIKVVGNGVDPRIFSTPKNQNRYKKVFDFPYVLVIGGLRERKGAPSILKIAKALEATGSDLKIVTVGQNHEPYLSQSKDLKNLVVLGMEPDDKLSNLLHHAFGFLFLSYYEGFGIPVLEAMAAGVPVISSNAASLPEVVGDAGILISPEDIAGATSILESWMKNPGQRDEWIEKGKIHVTQFTWTSCVERLILALGEKQNSQLHPMYLEHSLAVK